jgi:NADPH2:quinone reductase
VKLGARRAFDYQREDWVEGVKAETGGHGADVILDMVAGDYVEKDLEAVALEGRIVFIAFQKGPTGDLNIMRLMQKRATLTGSTLRVRSAEEKGAIARALLQHVWPKLEAGQAKPLIDSTFPLAEAAKAHARMESREHIGKIVLTARG